MARIIIDTRDCFSAHEAAALAGACDFDVVALVAKDFPNCKAVNAIDAAIYHWGIESHLEVIKIPCHSDEAAEAIRPIAENGDVIVTESCLVAREIIRQGGLALDNRGAFYSSDTINAKIEEFQRCRALVEKGIDPYGERVFTQEDREHLTSNLTKVAFREFGKVPRKRERSIDPFEPWSKGRVFVDGDGCFVVPEVIEACGNAHVPIVYVSNRKVRDLIAETRRRSSLCLCNLDCVPPITLKHVPEGKDQADNYIWKQITPADIVVCDDTGLAAKCLRKGALTIDLSGRICERVESGSNIGKKGVSKARKSSESGTRKKRKDLRIKSFRRSFNQLLALEVPQYENRIS